MKIAIPKETAPDESRCALTPPAAVRLTELGATVFVEAGAGMRSRLEDAAFREAGAVTLQDRATLLAEADLVLRVRKPPPEEVPLMKRGCAQISFLDPFRETELVTRLAARGISALSLELLPRSTRAQKMDALTSQANLAGYVAVILAAEHAGRILPLMMTAAGTISPARVLVIGAGVAGLQAIATAKRLGARVDAFDTRPAVEEQVRSLGARFIRVDLGETGQTKDGYAQALTEQQLLRQREAMARACAEADIVITAAQVFGRRAPILLTTETVAAMRPGSVVVDLAVENGGNVEGAEAGRVVEQNGVKILGFTNLAGRVPVHATQVYATNLANFVEEFWDREANRFTLRLEDEIIQSALVTHAGEVRPPPRQAGAAGQTPLAIPIPPPRQQGSLAQRGRGAGARASDDFNFLPSEPKAAPVVPQPFAPVEALADPDVLSSRVFRLLASHASLFGFAATAFWAPSRARAAAGAIPHAGHVARSSLELMPALFVFMLAAFVGLEVIRRVSRLLHTPLMSLTNAISAIAVVGAILVAGPAHSTPIHLLGLVAVAASVTNIVSGFLITDRMLKLFRKREELRPR